MIPFIHLIIDFKYKTTMAVQIIGLLFCYKVELPVLPIRIYILFTIYIEYFNSIQVSPIHECA